MCLEATTGGAPIPLLLLFSLCTSVRAQKVRGDGLEWNGVSFQQGSQIAFNKSRWTMVSDFALDRLSDTVGRAQKWIQN